MANNIALAKTFVPILDEIYKLASLTSKLDGAAELARQGANANELIVPMLSMQGLGDYSRNDGYVKGDVTMTNETVKCNYDRGRKFYVDALDERGDRESGLFPPGRRVHPHEGGAGAGRFPLRVLRGQERHFQGRRSRSAGRRFGAGGAACGHHEDGRR